MTEREDLLLQKALFDELTEHEQGELAQLMARSPQAKRKLEGLQRIVALTVSIPPEQPQEDLADRVIASLPLTSNKDHGPAKTPRERPVVQALRQRCPLYFFLAGVLHLLLGLTLHQMLRTPEALQQAPGWILRQPDFAFLTGAFFLFCGVLLLRNVPNAVRISYGGLLVYIVFVAVNGLALLLKVSSPQLLPGLLAFAGMGLTIGALLGLLMQHCNKEAGNENT